MTCQYLFPSFSSKFFEYEVVAVVYQCEDLFVGEASEEVELVPVFFVHVPCSRYLLMLLTQFDGIFWVAFQDKPFSVFKVYHGKYLA